MSDKDRLVCKVKCLKTGRRWGYWKLKDGTYELERTSEEGRRTSMSENAEVKEAAIEVLDDCQLEWDRPRGVLYVHNRATGSTVLRICGLDPKMSDRTLKPFAHMIDVTNPTIVGYPDA